MSNEKFKQVFDIAAPEYDATSNPFMVHTRKIIFDQWAAGRCLEVGAGTGEISKFLSNKRGGVVATDISPKMVQQMKKRGIEAYECDAENLPFSDNSFDSVISAEMLFYLDNPDNFLKEAYRVLRPEGRLLISCASNFPMKFYDKIRSALRSFGIKKWTCCDDPLKDFMTTPKLKAMLIRNGFNIVEEKKAPIFPFAALNSLNRIFAKTPLRHFGIFIFVYAQKN
ncbi:MAG: methyltransferase domain-containing protein [Patescibacteria group bacterium]